GTTATGCGMNGQACQTCLAWQTCRSQACVVDPNSRWDVIAVSTTFATTKPDGTCWDPGCGAPDPYAVCEIPSGTEVGRTLTVTDTFMATWDTTICPLALASELQGNHSICAWDGDPLGSMGDFAGCWPTNFTEADFRAGASGMTISTHLTVNNQLTNDTLTL